MQFSNSLVLSQSIPILTAAKTHAACCVVLQQQQPLFCQFNPNPTNTRFQTSVVWIDLGCQVLRCRTPLATTGYVRRYRFFLAFASSNKQQQHRTGDQSKYHTYDDGGILFSCRSAHVYYFHNTSCCWSCFSFAVQELRQKRNWQ